MRRVPNEVTSDELPGLQITKSTQTNIKRMCVYQKAMKSTEIYQGLSNFIDSNMRNRMRYDNEEMKKSVMHCRPRALPI